MKRSRSRNEEKAGANQRKKDEVGTSFYDHFFNMNLKAFEEKYFEKKHLVMSHKTPSFFTNPQHSEFPNIEWSTKKMLDLAEHKELHYGTDLNVVRFDKDKDCRISYKTEGRCTKEELNKCMKDGWSIRFLRPHEFIESNSAFIAMMEAELGCYCGLNSYWTPANSQGFAPHYDDVDVYLFQLEGEKEWRLYDPADEVGVLTRHSSEDFKLSEYPKAKFTFTLKAGDILYMPRGMVHQGRTLPHTHSLHITFSANQMHTWADLIGKMAAYSTGVLAANDVEWRRTLPRQLCASLGAIHNPQFKELNGLVGSTSEELAQRSECLNLIREKVAELSVLMSDEVHIDTSCDEYMKEVVHKLQPISRTYFHTMCQETEVSLNTSVRLVSKNCCRLSLNVDGEAQLFHCGENSPVCQQNEPGFFRFESVFAPAIATLLSRYPKYTKVSALPFPDFTDPEEIGENQLLLIENLRDVGLLQNE